MIPPNLPKPLKSRSDRARAFARGDAVVLLGSALYLLLFFPHPWFAPDSGYIAYGAERIVRGQIPYRDFFSELGPGTYYLQAAVFKLLGVSLSAVNAVVWLTGLAISWLLYRLSKRIIAGPLAILPSFIFIAVCYPTWYCLSHHWTGIVFVALMLLCMARSAAGGESRQPRSGKLLRLAAGCFCCLAFLCLQSMGVAALATVLVYALVEERLCGGSSLAESARNGWRRGVWFLAGFGALFAGAAAFLACKHAAHDWFYDNFTFLITSYWPWENPAGNYWNILTVPLSRLMAQPTFRNFSQVTGYYFFLAVEPALVVVGSFWWFRNVRSADRLRSRQMLLFVMVSVAVFLSEMHNPDLVHFVLGGVLFLPPLVAMAQALIRHYPDKRRILLPLAAVVCIFAAVGAGWQMVRAREKNTPVATRRGTLYVRADDAAPLAKRLEIVERRVPAGGETLFFSFDAWLYFATATDNPTRYDEIIAGFQTPAQIQEITQTLAQRKLRYIFSLNREEPWAARTHFSDVPEGIRPHPLEDFLRSPESPYRLEQVVDLMEVWTLKD